MKYFFLLLFGLTALVTADTLTTTDGRTLNGLFRSFRKGRLAFAEFDKAEPTELDIFQVARLTVTTPLETTFTPDGAAGKTPLKGTLKSYNAAKSTFSAVIDGKKRKFSPRTYAAIESRMDLQAFQQARDAFQKGTETAVPAQKAHKFLPRNQAAILHFDDGTAASKRQGNLCERLARESRGKVAYRCLPCPPDSEMAAVNGLQTTPQFWFYRADGSLARRFDERFTEEDLTVAAEALRKGK